MSLATIKQANPAVIQALQSRGVMIPGHPDQNVRRSDTVLYHRKAYEGGGHTELSFFDAAVSINTTNVESGRLTPKQTFHAQYIGCRIVPGINPTTGAAIAAASNISQAGAVGQPATATLLEQWHRIMEMGRLVFEHEDYTWAGDVAGLYHYPWGAGPGGIVGADSGNLANLIGIAIPVNGLPNRVRKLLDLAIVGDSPFKAWLRWPAALALGTAGAGNTAGFAEVGVFGTMFSDGNR